MSGEGTVLRARAEGVGGVSGSIGEVCVGEGGGLGKRGKLVRGSVVIRGAVRVNGEKEKAGGGGGGDDKGSFFACIVSVRFS